MQLNVLEKYCLFDNVSKIVSMMHPNGALYRDHIGSQYKRPKAQSKNFINTSIEILTYYIILKYIINFV